MSTKNDLNPHEILEALGVSDPASVTPVEGGMDTAIWRVEHNGQLSALRVFRAEQTRICQFEQAAIRAAALANVPAPQIEAAGTWRDRPALLMSWCGGQTLMAQLMGQPWRIWSLGLAFGRQQAAIHAVPAPPELVHPDRNWLDWAGPEEQPLKERLQRLSMHPLRLLHLDYHPLNLMVEGSRITGVLDWANARAGDPRADFARTYTILWVQPYEESSLVLTIMRWLLEKSWRAGYKQGSGPIFDTPDEMAHFYAWAGAAMVRDLAPRVDDPANWITAEHLAVIQRWTGRWKDRIGL